MRIAEMLRLYLAAKNMDQKDAASQIGVSESSFCRFLKGETNLDGPGMIALIGWCCKTDAVGVKVKPTSSAAIGQCPYCMGNLTADHRCPAFRNLREPHHD